MSSMSQGCRIRGPLSALRSAESSSASLRATKCKQTSRLRDMSERLYVPRSEDSLGTVGNRVMTSIWTVSHMASWLRRLLLRVPYHAICLRRSSPAWRSESLTRWGFLTCCDLVTDCCGWRERMFGPSFAGGDQSSLNMPKAANHVFSESSGLRSCWSANDNAPDSPHSSVP